MSFGDAVMTEKIERITPTAKKKMIGPEPS
jgi:hypothetical protein